MYSDSSATVYAAIKSCDFTARMLGMYVTACFLCYYTVFSNFIIPCILCTTINLLAVYCLLFIAMSVLCNTVLFCVLHVFCVLVRFSL